jgi:hypothetical protein
MKKITVPVASKGQGPGARGTQPPGANKILDQKHISK